MVVDDIMSVENVEKENLVKVQLLSNQGSKFTSNTISFALYFHFICFQSLCHIVFLIFLGNSTTKSKDQSSY